MTKKSNKAAKQKRYILITRIAGLLIFGTSILLVVLRRSELFASPQAQAFLDDTYNIFAGLFRTLLYAIGTYFTLAYVKLKTGRPASKFRKFSLISLTIITFVFIVLLPKLLGDWDFYLMFMPFPITTPVFQLPTLGHHFDHTFTDVNGINGARVALALYFGYHIIAYLGTFLWGRRWHCSVLCMLHGNTAETLGLGLPVIPSNKRRPQSKPIWPPAHRVLLGVQIFYIISSGSIVILWVLHFLFNITPIPLDTLAETERISYLLLGVVLMALSTIFLGSRAFCVYCPAGTVTGGMGRLAGQEITTNLTECINCGLCNQACKMSLDVMSAAQQKGPLRAINCVGCGLCVDICPTNNLAYTTTFTRWLDGRQQTLSE